MKNKFIYWCALIALVFLCLPATALAADNSVGVAYRGHIQDLGDYPADGSWVDSPEIIGTEGQSKRIEGFEIKLTGEIPTDLQNGLELRYNVHVQNKGWLYDENDSTNWPKDGDYAGTRGESLRIEAVKIVLTDSTGKSVSGYSVHYRGHVQNVGDLPALADTWYADGEQLGTVGSSLRLEALLVQVVKTSSEPVEPVVYDKAGFYGSATEPQTIAGDVIIAADGVTLQNLVIEGNLTISEAVGNGTVTLNNVTVKGDTFVRGGGVNSIHINGGQYSRIVMEKTASGAVRIVATGVDGLAVVISEDATGETIILEGVFESVTVNAPNMTVTTQGTTTIIGKLTVGAGAAGSILNLATGSTVTDLVLDGTAAVNGQGTVIRAEVNADGVVFEKAPGAYTVAPDVVIPPVFPTPNNGGGGGGGPTTITVSGVSLNKNSAALKIGDSETLTATVAPATATNKTVSWASSAPAVATVDAGTGLVTAVAVGTAKITVTTTDGNKQASCDVTVDPIAVTGVTITPQSISLVYGDTASVTATVAPVNATNPGITWTSSDTSVATVDQNGMVTAVYAGTATITASSQADSTIKATTEVTVQGRLSITQVKAVAGLEMGNVVSLFLEGDTFIDGNNDFVFNAGTTNLGLLPSATGDSAHRVFDFTNIAEAGTLTLQATGLTTGINSTTVSVTVLDPVMSFANTALTDTTASFSWPDLGEASGVTLQQQKSGESNWTMASCDVTPDVNATTAIVKDLLPATTYQFRLIVTDGATPGVSNSVTVMTKPVATAVNLNQSTADLIMGNTLSLTATVLPADAVNKTVTWTSDNTDVATVDLTTGLITGIDPGTAVITAETVNGFKASCSVTVKPLFAATTDGSTATISAYNGTETNVVIPATIDNKPVTAIEANAFSDKSTIQSVTVPATVTSIGANAFKNTGLTSVALPAVTSIGEGAFFNCNKLTTVSFDSGASLTAIPKNAFYKCTSLASITIPATVTSIGIYAFQDNEALTTITIPGSVTTIGEGAFYDCNTLAAVEFPASDSALTIGKNAFNREYALTGIALPARLTTLEEGAFHYCRNLTALSFAADCQLISIGRDGFSECPITSLTLPALLQTINEYSFYHNKLSGTLIIPAAVTSIGGNAFEGKIPGANLTALEINSSAASSIGVEAFKYHPLTTITLPANVTISTFADTMGTNYSGFLAAYTANGLGTYQFSSGWSK